MNKMIVFPNICAGHFPDDGDETEPVLKSKKRQIKDRGTSLASKKDFIAVAQVLQWMIDNKCIGMLGWRYIKSPNEVGGYYYRLCLTSAMHSEEDLAFIRLTFGSEIELLDDD